MSPHVILGRLYVVWYILPICFCITITYNVYCLGVSYIYIYACIGTVLHNTHLWAPLPPIRGVGEITRTSLYKRLLVVDKQLQIYILN